MEEGRAMDCHENKDLPVVHYSVDKNDIDQIMSLMNEIAGKAKEAKTLAGELASLLDGVSVRVDIRAE